MNERREIIIVDDDDGFRTMTVTALLRERYRVKDFSSATEALKHIEKNGADIVVTDVQMPDVNGIELVKRVRQVTPSALIIVITAFDSIEVAREAVKAGAYDYIDKSRGVKEVAFALQKAEERKRLEEENLQLREKLNRMAPPPHIIAESEAMQKVLELSRRVASTSANVLITGESGTGKDLIARYIHENSERAQKSFIAVNCGAIPDTLLESELFGYSKGAFTGANEAHRGLFTEAEGGTLFLDEIAELPENLQVKLLRAVQEGEVRPLGANESLKINVRIISSTLQNLQERVTQRIFREDLYYRLAVFPIHIPPLRDHPEDIIHLARYYFERFNSELGLKMKGIAEDAERELMRQKWFGNVRELTNTIKRAMIMCENEFLTAEMVKETAPTSHKGDATDDLRLGDDNFSFKESVRNFEVQLIKKALSKTGGNRTQAAKLLGMNWRTFMYKLKEYGIS